MANGISYGAIEVSWARQLAERAEREYTAMVDGLLAENQQLENLARLLVQQLAEAEGQQPEQADAPMLSQAEDLLKQCGELRRLREEEVQTLQKQLQDEQLESQSLRRQLEDTLKELAELRGPAPAPEVSPLQTSAGSESSLQRRLAEAERNRKYEARSREIVEARCALIEIRCERTVQRLEAELALLRHGAPSVAPGQSSSRASGPPASNPPSPSSDAQSLREQAPGSKFHRNGGVPGLHSLHAAGRHSGPDHHRGESDDEDYAWEGSLERKVGEGFEKVFVELTHDRLRIRGGHNGSTGSGAPVLDEWPLSELAGPAELLTGSLIASRCFQVVRQSAFASPLVFRCLSERRAAQWVEAINRAWGRPTA